MNESYINLLTEAKGAKKKLNQLNYKLSVLEKVMKDTLSVDQEIFEHETLNDIKTILRDVSHELSYEIIPKIEQKIM